MRLFIHAGIHRTGSTSLQRFFATNREALVAQRVLYPGTEVNHQKLVWALHRGQAGPHAVLALVEEAAATGAMQVVLSGEDFAIHRDLAWLEAVARDIDTHVIFYLRRQDHWVMSWYNQHVKWPFSAIKSQMDPGAFLETLEDFYWLDYAALLEGWRNVLGPDRVAVGVVERGQVEDVTLDFLDRLCIAREGLVLDGRSNDSLPVHMLEIARHLGLHALPNGERMRVLNALHAGLGNRIPGATTVYSPEERMGILARFEASNRIVAQEWLGREKLFLEPPPSADAPYYQFPDIDRETLMRDWVAPLIRELVRPGPRS